MSIIHVLNKTIYRNMSYNYVRQHTHTHTQFSLSPIRKKYPDVSFPGAMWDRAVATSFPARERGWPVKRARTLYLNWFMFSIVRPGDQYNGSLAKTTHLDF